jgi:acyl-CoA synthetase (AMP-forming)/AMP-acid ligase II
MQGLMQRQPLLVSDTIRHAARHHGGQEIVSKLIDGTIHRTTWRQVERRSRQLARVLQQLGIAPGERVGSLAWNGFRHLELFYGVSGSGVILHTINPRLALDDIAYIATHAGDVALFVDTSFAELAAQLAPHLGERLRHVVMLCPPAELPAVPLPPGVALHCYETLMDQADDSFTWPVLDENTGTVVCYTSGTTGRPKGVLYSNRSAVLHAMMAISPDVFAMRATDCVMPGAQMFHGTAWGLPYCAAIVGAKLVLTGRYLDGASLATLMQAEGVTFMIGVPTIWFGLLDELRRTNQRPRTLQRILVAGSALPRLLVDAFGTWGVDVQQGWGMTETSPIVTYNAPVPPTAGLSGEDLSSLKLRQGRCVFGADIKVVDAEGHELPWDGAAFGDLKTRGPWVVREYMGGDGVGADADGWFHTGDVATVDANGFIELVDRTKDLIKSGGEWISSIALENIAVAHPDVREAAAIAVPHPKWVERPLVLVVPKEGGTVDPASVLAMYEGQVAKWWIPDRVMVVDDLPHTATGKLNKLALRARFGSAYAD